jgi:hypothetical protein
MVAQPQSRKANPKKTLVLRKFIGTHLRFFTPQSIRECDWISKHSTGKPGCHPSGV